MLQAAVAAGWAHTVGYQLGRRDEARAVLLRALDRLEDPAARRRVAGALLDEGLASPDEIAAHVVDDPGAPAGAFGAAVDALLKGRFDVLFRRVDLALEHEATWGAEFTTLSVLLRVVRVVGLVLSGRATEAASRAQASYEETSTAEYPRGAWCFVRGLVATVRGLPETAIEALGEADGALRAADAGLLMPTHAYLAMACAATASGIPAAVEALEAAQRDAQTLGRLFSPEVRRAAGWHRGRPGRPPRGARALRRRGRRGAGTRFAGARSPRAS